jgi:hypothetical protein
MFGAPLVALKAQVSRKLQGGHGPGSANYSELRAGIATRRYGAIRAL